MAVKLLLDTDIGSDIDDAVCLAYLLANPECELLGVTTVSGEGEQRAQMASALCALAGREVPIHIGREHPLIPGLAWQPKCPQADALARWKHDTGFPRGQAVEFMRRAIRDHPGEVTLLAIGPLTNVAALFAADAEIPALLRSLVLMGGVFTNRLAGVGPLEWNAMLDPGATAIVYGQAPTIFRSIGLDVTCQVKMPAAEVRRRFQVPLLRPVLDFAEIWFRERPEITFHDPLAAATIFDPEICAFERGCVTVELASPRLPGMTHWAADPDGPHEVALQVDPQRFFEHFFACFPGESAAFPGAILPPLADSPLLSLKDRLKSQVKASVSDALMPLLQASFNEALAAENIALSGPERRRLFEQVAKDILAGFGEE
ncbi:MAG: nucleoside hydrolase [Chloroflexota bacterium]